MSVEDRFAYLQLSLASREPPSVFLDDGVLWQMFEAIREHYASEDIAMLVLQDRNGYGATRLRKVVRASDFSLDGYDSFVVAIHPRSERWVPPILSLGASRPTIGLRAFEVSWSLLASHVDEQAYVRECERQLALALAAEPLTVGFGGPSHEPSNAHMNTPFWSFMKINRFTYDPFTSMAGAHWINLVPNHLLSPDTRGRLIEAGAELTIGEQSTTLRLSDVPSELTDETVTCVMNILGSAVFGDTSRLAPHWWRNVHEYGETQNVVPIGRVIEELCG